MSIDLALVETDALLTELANRYDGMLFGAYAGLQAAVVKWKWRTKGPVSMHPFVLALIERQMRADLEQVLASGSE